MTIPQAVHLGCMPAESLQRVMLAVIEQPEAAREQPACLGIDDSS
jgi:hypothetical protein